MEKSYLTEIKAAVTAVMGALTAWLGVLAWPVYILVLLNIIDYATGLTAAPYRGEERSSDKGFRGIAKKICMWLLVALGAILDWLLYYAAGTVGLALPFNFLVGCLVAIWLICNEIVSILENISDIGVELPPFLMTLVQWVKQAAEEKGTIKKDKGA